METLDSVLSGLGTLVYHNTPYLLKKADGSFIDPKTGEKLGFDHRFIGKGEGRQVYGWGSYFSVKDLRKYGFKKKTDEYYLYTEYGYEKIKLNDVFNFDTDKIKDNLTAAAKSFIRVYFKEHLQGNNRKISDIINEQISEHEDDKRRWVSIENTFQKLQEEDPKKFEEHNGNSILNKKYSEDEEKEIIFLKNLLSLIKNDTPALPPAPKKYTDAHNYVVEIPDNDGFNYLEWDKPLTKKQREIIIPAFKKADAKKGSDWLKEQINLLLTMKIDGELIYDAISSMLWLRNNPRGASKFLRKLGIVGIHYFGRQDGECYVIFDENDAKIVKHELYGLNGIKQLQNYSSAKTSLPSNEPKGFKLIDWQKGTVNLDLGGGKTTFGTDYLKAKGVKNLIFDFNYPAEHNKEIAEYVRKNKVDTVTCFNVLNVLDTKEAISNMCLMAAKALKDNGTAYFQVYHKKDGKGASQNNQSYQQGEPLSFYVPFVSEYFENVKKTAELITASKPKKTAKKSQWQFAFDSDEGILFGLGDIELDTTDYDSKHINNLAPGKNIPESIIENLNKNGMTVENIEKLQDSGFPVCKYKTQITVHGNCPELKSNYVGYYSCLVKNQNNSLGIKWNGIDTEKKERIIKLALDVRSIFKKKEHIITKNGDGYYINNCWNRYWNSTVTYLWQAVTITEGERRYSWQLTQTDKDNINAIAKKISEKLKGLFFGYIEVHYPVIKITILGIYEKNMDKFCQAVFDYTQSEIKGLYDEYKKLADEKWQLQQLQREKAEKERDEYFEEWKKQNPMPENFVPISRYPVKGDIIAEYWGKYTGVSMAKDGGYYFDKESFKPEIVFQKFYNSFGKLCYRRCDKDGNFTERHGDEFKGEYPKDWYLKTNAVTKPKPPEKKPETPTVTTTPGGNSYNLQIVDYSEKGVVLTGDTKPIKDEIKALGGKFGMRFDTSKVPSGVGWIFPKTKLAEIEKLVAKYSTKGGNIETDKALQMLELQLVSDSGLGCLKLDTLSGLTPINKLKRINQIEKLPNETDII